MLKSTSCILDDIRHFILVVGNSIYLYLVQKMLEQLLTVIMIVFQENDYFYGIIKKYSNEDEQLIVGLIKPTS